MTPSSSQASSVEAASTVYSFPAPTPVTQPQVGRSTTHPAQASTASAHSKLLHPFPRPPPAPAVSLEHLAPSVTKVRAPRHTIKLPRVTSYMTR